MKPPLSFDQDALISCADLVKRTGAREFEVGYVHDDVPMHEAGWYATAMYKGARLMVADQSGPIEACDALSRRLLDGATCNHCKKPVVLNDQGPGCRWMRLGDRWRRGCET